MIYDELDDQIKAGVHVQLLINRGINNANSCSKRWIRKLISTSNEEYDANCKELIDIQNEMKNPDIRLYASLNPRNMDKAILMFKHRQLDVNDNKKVAFYKKINDSFVSCLMSPECKERKYYLVDLDTESNIARELVEDLIATQGEDLIIFSYETPNGFHYVMKRFNVKILDGIFACEVKKDGLILLNTLR